MPDLPEGVEIEWVNTSYKQVKSNAPAVKKAASMVGRLNRFIGEA